MSSQIYRSASVCAYCYSKRVMKKLEDGCTPAEAAMMQAMMQISLERMKEAIEGNDGKPEDTKWAWLPCVCGLEPSKGYKSTDPPA